MTGSQEKMSLSSAPQHPWTHPKALWWEEDRRAPGREWMRDRVRRVNSMIQVTGGRWRERRPLSRAPGRMIVLAGPDGGLREGSQRRGGRRVQFETP